MTHCARLALAMVATILIGACTAIQPIAPTAPAGSTAGSPAPALEPQQVSTDTQGLPYSWQANLVPATPYTADQPPGPTGLPEHIEINFGVVDPADRQPGDPILYIIPVNAYRALWDQAGNPQVSATIDQIFKWTTALQSPPPTSGLPALPTEEIGGVNDLAVQIGRVEAETDSASRSGYRFVGRWAQDANPVTNQGLRYVYQGFTNDGAYLVAFFYPVTTQQLPNDVAAMPQAEMDAFNAGPQGYIQAQAETLNSLASSDWQPNLATLDAVVASLRIQGMPATGLHDGTWHWVASTSSDHKTPVANPEKYRVIYHDDGRLEWVADCNKGSGGYTWTGGVVGGMRTDLPAATLPDCGPDSLSQQLYDSLRAAQDFRIQPGGDRLHLNMPAGGPVLNFVQAGAAAAP